MNARWVTGHDTCCQRPASATVQPRPATSAPSSRRSRVVSLQRGGTAGSDSVNVLRGHSGRPHFHRRLHHATDTSSRPRRRSRGRVSAYSCTRPERVPQSGHDAASG